MYKPNIGDLRVWWIPQIPGKPFHVPVANKDEAVLIMETLAHYDLFQLANNIKPDYNAGGLEIYEADVIGAGWCEWYDDETGENIDDYARSRGAA